MRSLADLNVTESQLVAFCEKWHIIKLEFFGSVLRDDFRSDSDIDLLMTCLPSIRRTLFQYVDMLEEAELLFHRKVDLVYRQAVEQSRNPYRKESILSNTKIIYAAA